MMMTTATSPPPPPATFSDLRTLTTSRSFTSHPFLPFQPPAAAAVAVASATNRRSSTIASTQSRRNAVEYLVEEEEEREGEEEEERRSRRRGRRIDPNELGLDSIPERGRGGKMRGFQKKGSKGGRGEETMVVEKKEDRKLPRMTHKLLRVLGGKAKRKKLLSPTDMDVRPMMEVVKGATFDILQSAGGCHASLRPGRWLDLYSGTGSVGIEALSRGCSEVHFVEMDPWVVSNVLQPNLEWTEFLDVSVIHTIPVERFMQQAELNAGKTEPFDYVSVTPPYTQVDYKVLMGQFSSSPLIGKNTFMVVEYPIGMSMLDSCGVLVKLTDRRFGRTNLAIYGPVWADKRK